MSPLNKIPQSFQKKSPVKPSAFAKGEDGAGTVFGLFMFVIIAMLLGVGLDFTNTWRNRTLLSSSADMAAHAGVVAMAKGEDADGIKAAVLASMDTNMPRTLFGNVYDATTDIHLADYDRETGAFKTISSSDPNAVVVEVYRTKDRGNPVASYLMNFLGIDALDVDAVSAAVFEVNGVCDHTDGIYAKSTVTLSSQADIGSGFCIHSEKDVWLPQQNTFQSGSMVTMPDLTDCKSKCVDSANPGIHATEAHMVLGDFGEKIMDTYATFEGPIGTSGNKFSFFHDDPTDAKDPVITLGDTTALVALLGISTPKLGDVIEMTQAEIMTLTELPSGLVYDVQCAKNGSGTKTILVFSNSSMKMDGSVLLTNCNLQFDSGSSVKSSVVITTRNSNSAVISANSNVAIGDPSLSCDATGRSHIMSMSKVSVPAEFVMSNVTLTVDDDVKIASATSSGATSYGFAIYATGEVHISSQHKFRTCGTPGDWMAPEPKNLRLVRPPISML